MIALGYDQSGYDLKCEIIKYLENNDIAYLDLGARAKSVTDYPKYAKLVCNSILSGVCDKGILICDTGIGISITANRFKGIRAALCGECFSAQATREHNDANVLSLGASVTGTGLAIQIVETFLNTPFSGDERHLARIRQIEE